jgi:hypothetical protein
VTPPLAQSGPSALLRPRTLVSSPLTPQPRIHSIDAQPQQPPPQHPPAAGTNRPDGPEDAPAESATVESSRTVSSCPDGHVAGSADAVMGLLSSKVAEHSRQRNS